MFRQARFRTKNIPVCLCLLVTCTSCNIDWAWRDRQAPDGPVVADAGAGRATSGDEAVDVSMIEAREVDLVEAMIGYRTAYRLGLEQLRAYYEARGYATKLGWAEFELSGVRAVKPFRYLLDAEIPDGSLHAAERIADADALLDRGRALMRRGGHGVPALFRRDQMIQAAKVLRDLVVRYPTSDKIDDAAFLLGEIHKEYLPGQESIAVKWYERAWTWNPQTPHPARFQAAVVYDYRLHDRDRALELYQEVMAQEGRNTSNVRFASRRVYELSRNQPIVRAVAR